MKGGSAVSVRELAQRLDALEVEARQLARAILGFLDASDRSRPAGARPATTRRARQVHRLRGRLEHLIAVYEVGTSVLDTMQPGGGPSGPHRDESPTV